MRATCSSGLVVWVEPVVASHDVQRREGDAAVAPARVLRVVLALAGQYYAVLAERLAAGKESFAYPLKPLVGIVASSVAVRPLVVARSVDKRILGALEPLQLFVENPILARRASALDVTVMDDEG